MATINAPGLGSNLDVNSIVSQLMTVERQPATALDKKEAGYQAQLTAWGSVKGALSTFQNAVKALSSPAKFSAQKATVADTAVASVSAGSTAASGNYAIDITTLAQAQKLKSGTFSTLSSLVGTGTLTFEFGTYSGDNFTLNSDKSTRTVTIAAGQDSLAGIRDAINNAAIGVTAGIVNDGTAYRLTLASSDSGAANALRITALDSDGNNTDTSGLSKLVYDGRSPSGVQNLAQTVAAQNATFSIDGIAINKASNIVTDAIEGVTLNLLKENSSTTLAVARDSAGIGGSVSSFVKAYNDARKTLADLSAYNASTKQAAVLMADSAVRNMQSQMRGVLNTPLLTAGGGLSTLSDIGVSFQKDGTLALDSAKLQAVVNDPTRDISTLFAAVGKPSDSLVSFGSAPSTTQSGQYALNVTRLATQASAAGGLDLSIAGTASISAGVNDVLSLTVDGTSTSVTLSAGTYTPAQLAAQFQSRINGSAELAAKGSTVTVSVVSGKLVLTSNRYGSTSKVEAVTGTAAADTFGAVDYTNGTGLDVAGTIGGVAATGSGQLLTGNGDAAGLVLTVTGSTTGDRGTVRFAQGYAAQLDQVINTFLASDGMVAARTSGIQTSIKQIGNRRDVLNARLVDVEKRYRAQFTALDVMMSNMTKTSSYLSQQLANLPGSSSNNK